MNLRALSACLLASVLLLPSAAPGNDALSRIKQLQSDTQQAIDKVINAYVMFPNGSGVAITEDGYGLTNDHVAGMKQEWVVEMPNPGNPKSPAKYKAKCLGRDRQGDLYYFKLSHIEPERANEAVKVPFVPLGDSDTLQIGQTVIALGNPFGFSINDATPTVTLGVVSDIQKNHNNYTDAVQTDAAINPGNSGGPLITTAGELVGINGQVAVRFGGRYNTGAAYAISSNQIKRFLDDMAKANGGNVPHGAINGLWLDNTPEGETGGKGALVMRVAPNSTAEKAGFKKNDIVTAIEGISVDCTMRCRGLIQTFPASATVTIDVLRGAETVSIEASLRDGALMDNPDRPRLGITAREEPVENGGVVVESVQVSTPAAEAGLQPGDVITRIAGIAIKDRTDLMAVLDKHKAGDTVEVTYSRESKQHTVEIKLAGGEQRPGPGGR